MLLTLFCSKHDAADLDFEIFVNQNAALYNQNILTLNIHRLLHLTDEVRNLGPLHNFSSFLFEDKNELLSKMVRGARYTDSQVVSEISSAPKPL